MLNSWVNEKKSWQWYGKISEATSQWTTINHKLFLKIIFFECIKLWIEMIGSNFDWKMYEQLNLNYLSARKKYQLKQLLLLKHFLLKKTTSEF